MPYRVYLLQSGHIHAAHTFTAQHDEEARQLAYGLFQAACDEFERCELWCGPRHICGLSRGDLGAALLDLASLSLRRQEALREMGEIMQNRFQALRNSRLLLARLEELRGLIDGHGAAGKPH